MRSLTPPLQSAAPARVSEHSLQSAFFSRFSCGAGMAPWLPDGGHVHGSSRRVCLHTPQRLRNSLLLSRKRYGGHDIKTYVVKGTEWPGLPSPFYFFSILLSTTAGTRMEPLSTEWEKKKEKKKRREQIMTLLSYLGRCSRQSLLGHGRAKPFSFSL